MSNEIYLINEQAYGWRWVSVVENENDWGLKLTKLRGQPINSDLDRIEIEWTPETENETICDFPNFRSNLKCLSLRAFDVLGALLTPYGQWVELVGLEYIAFYCLKISDSMDQSRTSEVLRIEGLRSFHHPRFAPVLKSDSIPNADAFRLPESISKVFVSERFRQIYYQQQLTGLDFIPVPMI